MSHHCLDVLQRAWLQAANAALLGANAALQAQLQAYMQAQGHGTGFLALPSSEASHGYGHGHGGHTNSAAAMTPPHAAPHSGDGPMALHAAAPPGGAAGRAQSGAGTAAPPATSGAKSAAGMDGARGHGGYGPPQYTDMDMASHGMPGFPLANGMAGSGMGLGGYAGDYPPGLGYSHSTGLQVGRAGRPSFLQGACGWRSGTLSCMR